MLKLHKEQRGFAIWEVLLVCGVLALLGFLAFRVYQRDNKSASPSQKPENITQSHNAFGFNVLRELNKDNQENVFISPTSIALALSMVYNGANGETKDAMTQALQLQGLDVTKLNEESLGLLESLNFKDGKVELALANSVWIREGLDYKPEFTTVVKDYYQAENKVLNFDDSGAPDSINAWVSDNTRGKITKIIDEIPDDFVMYLINATYFKGTWTTEFDKNATRDREFTPDTGAAYSHPLMQQSGEYGYLKTDEFESVSLPYGEDKRLSMYVFLPKDLKAFTDELSINQWSEWMRQYKTMDGTVLLPRFKTEYQKELKDVLSDLGMEKAFSFDADFSGIGEGLTIGQVLHKTYLDVNEEGTEAAAVTSVGMVTTSVGESESFYLEVNRPFFIAIYDSQSGELLFTGAIHSP